MQASYAIPCWELQYVWNSDFNDIQPFVSRLKADCPLFGIWHEVAQAPIDWQVCCACRHSWLVSQRQFIGKIEIWTARREILRCHLLRTNKGPPPPSAMPSRSMLWCIPIQNTWSFDGRLLPKFCCITFNPNYSTVFICIISRVKVCACASVNLQILSSLRLK